MGRLSNEARALRDLNNSVAIQQKEGNMETRRAGASSQPRIAAKNAPKKASTRIATQIAAGKKGPTLLQATAQIAGLLSHFPPAERMEIVDFAVSFRPTNPMVS